MSYHLCHQAPSLLAGTDAVVSHGSTSALPSLCSVLPWHLSAFKHESNLHYSQAENSADFPAALVAHNLWQHLAYNAYLLGQKGKPWKRLLSHCFPSPYSIILFFLHHFLLLFIFDVVDTSLITYLFVLKYSYFYFFLAAPKRHVVHVC